MALATVVALATVLGGVAPVAIRALEVTNGAPAALTGVPVKVDTPGKAAPAKVVNQATRTYKATAARWPAATSGSVVVQAAAAGQAAGPKASIPGTPLWVQSAAGVGRGATTDAAVSSKVSATVLPHSQAAPLGVSGLVLQLGGQAPGNGKVRVGLDYASFAQAYGGNYGSRLELVELPGCALTTPRLAACRVQTPVGSAQDYKGTSVSAVVTLDGRGDAALSDNAKTTAATAGVVLAATTTTGSEGGADGAYPPTKLEPDGTWSEGGDAGAFTYSYPIALPSARGSLTPSVALAYDSQSVDGTTATTQAQANWLGDGWSTPDSSIGLETTACADDPEGSASPTANTGDQCYDGEIVQMDLSGTDTPLVLVSSATSGGVTTSTWKAQDDSGEVITHVAPGSTVFDKYNTSSPGSDYWTVTERDGTEYEFGLKRPAGLHLRGRVHQLGRLDAGLLGALRRPVLQLQPGFTSSVCDDGVPVAPGLRQGRRTATRWPTTTTRPPTTTARTTARPTSPYISRLLPGPRSTTGSPDGNAYSNPPDQVCSAPAPGAPRTTCAALSSSNPSAASSEYPDVPAT